MFSRIQYYFIMLGACLTRILFPKARQPFAIFEIIREFVPADKPPWTKSIFSRTFPILQKLSKSSGYPGWRAIFQRYPVGIVGPADEGHVGRIFRIISRKGAGQGQR
ncbi:hypothetical protein [Solidesulfovibrio magneticus]|uniref:hypothetical protein n=1 Tax=Solidesulfovibrio magneticus TaxID=184917 RepID=UPI0013052911|nr:hypothetical protein [Solidesulfovibrio magneticus]